VWTTIDQVFCSRDSQNGWAHFGGAWHKILPGSADGVTNVYLLLVTAKGNNRQAYVVQDGSGNITQAYL
jgi:hypothetical protein